MTAGLQGSLVYEREGGVEPPSQRWSRCALPLCYSRLAGLGWLLHLPARLPINISLSQSAPAGGTGPPCDDAGFTCQGSVLNSCGPTACRSRTISSAERQIWPAL